MNNNSDENNLLNINNIKYNKSKENNNNMIHGNI